MRKTVYNTSGEATEVIDYANGFVYNTNYGDVLPQLSFFPMSEGRVVSLGSNSFESQYWLKDHLGSIRLEFDRNASVSSAYGYYAYGQISQSYNNSNPNDKYKFTGKERDVETGYDYFPPGRTYDSRVPHWLQIDPLADKYPGWSPYNYCLNNPLRFVDPDGNDPTGVTEVAVAAATVAIGTGIAITATYLATKNYLEHPSAINFPNQTNITNITIGLSVGVYNTISSWFSSNESEAKTEKNTKIGPYEGDVNVVDDKGNVIPLKQGQTLEGNKDGNMVQVKDKDKKPTGTRKDGKGHPKSKAPKAKNPHANRVDENGNPITDSNGNPHLPIKQ